MIKDEVIFGGHLMMVLAERCLYWPQENLLVISDVHLGKSNHFRKAGIALSKDAELGDLQRIENLILKCKPDTVIFLGDLFHSHYNLQWDAFSNWLQLFTSVKFILVQGNHDLLSPDKYVDSGIECVNEFVLHNLCFSHEPLQNEERFNICGHIHPGIKLVGKGNQSVRLPCFYLTKYQLILPAFGSLTGLYIIEPRKDELVYGIANSTLYRYGL